MRERERERERPGDAKHPHTRAVRLPLPPLSARPPPPPHARHLSHGFVLATAETREFLAHRGRHLLRSPLRLSRLPHPQHQQLHLPCRPYAHLRLSSARPAPAHPAFPQPLQHHLHHRNQECAASAVPPRSFSTPPPPAPPGSSSAHRRPPSGKLTAEGAGTRSICPQIGAT